MGCVKQKGPHYKCPELLSYQKKEGRVWPSQSFFGMTPPFQERKIFFFFKNCKVGVIPKRGMGATTPADPSFGMTTTQAIRDLFM